MKKKDVVLKERNSSGKFLPKPVNLLLKEKRFELWEKVKKIANIVAISFSSIFLLIALFTFSYFWFLSSSGASLAKRAGQAKTKIRSFKKEEKTYLFLIEKLENAQKILNSRGNISEFLKEIDLLLPSEVIPRSLSVQETGEVTLALSCSSLSEIESLNDNLKRAINEGKILEVKIGGVTKEKDSLYVLSLSFRLKKSET